MEGAEGPQCCAGILQRLRSPTRVCSAALAEDSLKPTATASLTSHSLFPAAACKPNISPPGAPSLGLAWPLC